MESPTVIHSTFVIERNYPTTPERVFAALADPVKKRRWFAEGEHHTVDTYQPASRFWAIQSAETAVFVALAVLLLTVSLWWVTRRSA